MPKRNIFCDEHVCPWWLTFTFDNPLRRLVQNPGKILGEYIRLGNVVADIGCGMGYFSLEMARLVGDGGRVYAVDIQPEMLAGVRRRALRAGLASRISLQRCTPESLGLEARLDFALAFWMVHEVPDQEAFFAELFDLLKPGARCLVVEPRLHVGGAAFAKSLITAQAAGLQKLGDANVAFSYAALFYKPVR